MSVLDTNIVVRHVTRDNPDQAARAQTLLENLRAGVVTALFPEAVLVEAIQVLSSARLYGIPRGEIRGVLGELIRLRGVRMLNKRVYLRALELYETYRVLSFVDSLCAAYAELEQPPTVISFDHGFDRIPGITREEP